MTSVADGAEEFGRVLGDIEADNDDGGDVQTDNAVEDGLSSRLHSLSGVVGLSSDDTDRLDTAVSKGCLREHLPESEEPRRVNRSDSTEVIVPRLLAPVLATCVNTVDTSGVCDDPKYDKRDQKSDLQTGEEELNLSVPLHAKEVSGDADDQEYSDVYA